MTGLVGKISNRLAFLCGWRNSRPLDLRNDWGSLRAELADQGLYKHAKITKLTNLSKLILIASFGMAFSDAHAFSRPSGVPNLFEDGPQYTAQQYLLGNSCYSLRASPIDLECNPAFLAQSRKTAFQFSIWGTDQVLAVYDYYGQLNADDSLGVVDTLLNERGPLLAKASASFWYQNEWWAVGVVPARGGFAYLNRNPAFPEISTIAFREWELFGKVGLFTAADENFQVGLQSRFVQREYVYQQFYADDVFADPSLLPIRNQSTLYLEPGFAYEWDSSLRPTLAGMVRNISLFQTGDQLPSRPIFEIGFSSGLGHSLQGFRGTTHYSTQAPDDQFFRGFSWSGMYEFSENFNSSITLGQNLFGFGANCKLWFATLGGSFKSQDVMIDNWTKANVSTFALDLGAEF